MFYFNLLLAILASCTIFCASGCVCDPLNQPTTEKTAMAQNAGPTWNIYAASRNFSSYPQTANTTFEQAYNGSNYESDAAGITHDINQALGTDLPPVKKTDLLNVTLTNWPD